MITKKYYKLIRVSHADEGYFYIKNVSNEIGEFNINNYSSNGTLEYSLDGVNWTSYDLTTKPSVNVNPNSNIYLRGTNFKNNKSGSVINFTKDYTVGGNFMSLSNYATMSSVTTIDSNNYIQYVFYQQTHLVSAADLNFGNVTTIGTQGFYGVFQSCSYLITPPDFSNVTSIGSQGLNEVFKSCSSLITPPDFSSVTSIGDNGLYSAFSNCSSLTTGPDLSSVTSIGNNGLNNTFSNCSSLTTGPDLSNVTSIGTYCLYGAFQSCTKLSSATAPNVQDLTQNNVLSSWLQNAGTQATGTKVVNVPTGATITTGSGSGIPSGWTRVDY